jgi:hypothetical protein
LRTPRSSRRSVPPVTPSRSAAYQPPPRRRPARSALPRERVRSVAPNARFRAAPSSSGVGGISAVRSRPPDRSIVTLFCRDNPSSDPLDRRACSFATAPLIKNHTPVRGGSAWKCQLSLVWAGSRRRLAIQAFGCVGGLSGTLVRYLPLASARRTGSPAFPCIPRL